MTNLNVIENTGIVITKEVMKCQRSLIFVWI